MRLSSMITFVTGLAVAGGSAYLARDFLENKYARVPAEKQETLVNVIVAAQDIPFGRVIESHSLTTMPWPREAVPAGTFTQYSTLLPESGNPSRRARRAISQGELILVSKVSDFGEKVTITQTLGPNHRAMAIKVNAVTAVGGFVTPGDRVDILLTQGRGENLKTVTILQNARIIGVDQDADEQTDSPEVARTVTVEVTPGQGQKLALAQTAGVLNLTLRTLEATTDVPLEAIQLSDVMGEISPLEQEKHSTKITVRRGTAVSTTILN